MRSLLAALVVAALAVSSCSVSDDGVVVAAGTTLVDSGFMDQLADAYEEDTGNGVKVVGLSSAEALAYLDAGTADIAITHNPVLLATYQSSNPEAISAGVFASEFIVVGPDATTTHPSVGELFRSVADQGLPFVSRDDGSGTHAREIAIWDGLDVDPSDAPWYVRTGTGMGATLQVADQRRAVTLSELGAYLTAASTVSLAPMPLEATDGLDNPYVATFGGDADDASRAFVDWLSSDAGVEAIDRANRVLFGVAVYRSP